MSAKMRRIFNQPTNRPTDRTTNQATNQLTNQQSHFLSADLELYNSAVESYKCSTNKIARIKH